ncbi:MAG: TIGR02449 family protein [Pseudomonadota bacterium]
MIDPLKSDFYSGLMDSSDSRIVSDLELKALESRVDDLISACQNLKQENQTLKVRQDTLVAERAALIEKTEMAKSRVEAMITRLKSLETGS